MIIADEKILLYDPSTVIIKFLIHLQKEGKNLELFVLQSPDKEKSQKASKILTESGIKVILF